MYVLRKIKQFIGRSVTDMVYRPVCYVKHDISETLFCLRFQVELTQFSQQIELISVSAAFINVVGFVLV
jgi:hypothetical protein